MKKKAVPLGLSSGMSGGYSEWSVCTTVEIPKEASKHLAQLVELTYLRLTGTLSLGMSSDSSGQWFGTGLPALQFSLLQVPRHLPREWCHMTRPYGPVPVSYGCGCKCRRHCTASSQHSFGRAKDLMYYTHRATLLQDIKQYLCEAVSETTSSAGAELAPLVTQVTHSQAVCRLLV